MHSILIKYDEPKPKLNVRLIFWGWIGLGRPQLWNCERYTSLCSPVTALPCKPKQAALPDFAAPKPFAQKQTTSNFAFFPLFSSSQQAQASLSWVANCFAWFCCTQNFCSKANRLQNFFSNWIWIGSPQLSAPLCFVPPLQLFPASPSKPGLSSC